MKRLAEIIVFTITFCMSGSGVFSSIADTPLNFYLSFDNFDFLEEDFVNRSGLKTIEDRGLTLEEGKFRKGLKMNLTPSMKTLHEMSGADLDMVTGAMFRTGARRNQWTTDNEPFLWGASKLNPSAGAVAFWVKGPLSEGLLFNQSAMRCGRPEQYLLSITVSKELKVGAFIEDARYVKHTILSDYQWEASSWNHVALNWDKTKGLVLFINGVSVASSWGTDSWWETALPGLMHLPMHHVVYDELYIFSRPLTDAEIRALMTSNKPPVSPSVQERTTDDRDRLAQAFGLSHNLQLPVISPLPENSVLSFREVTPEFTGDHNIPDRFCRDGRYELAWPHPLAVFTPIPGDASFQAEKLDVVIPKGETFNYVTLEGNLTGLPAALTDCRKEDDHYTGNVFFSIPEDDRFFYGTTLGQDARHRFTLPFLKGYGAPQHFQGNLHLPLTGDTRIHELGLFDVTETEIHQLPGELTYYLRDRGSLEYRYDFAMRTLNSLDERRSFFGYQTKPEGNSKWIETGYMTRMNLITAPLTGRRCIGRIILDVAVRTNTPDDVLLIRLRDPALPYRIWMHAEVKLHGFDREGGRLRLMLDPPPLILAENDVIWLDITSYNTMKMKVGGSESGKIILKPAPFFESERAYEMKALMPALAECTKAHYQPWLFEKIWPDIMNPHTFGGHFDSLVPALVVKRVLPHSRIAEQYIELGNKPEGHVRELEKSKKEREIKSEDGDIKIPSDIPVWAYLQHKIQNFRYRVVEWMIRNQNPDGQLAEGWNDDPFMCSAKYDILLDGFDMARDMYLRFFEGMDETFILGDGYIQISPLDSLHAWDFHCERWQSVLCKPGDPYIIRRALKTAWYLGKPDRTPQYYNNGEPFMYAHNILQWYWGKNARRVYKCRNPQSVEELLIATVKQCDDVHFFRFTEAWNTMRSLSGERMLAAMIIGGWEGSTRSPHIEDRSISVSWPSGGGEDLARWVIYADSTKFDCRMFSFDILPRKVTGRLFRIDPGMYEITLSEDKDGSPGNVLSSVRQEMMRYNTFTVTIPSKKPVFLSVHQVKKFRNQGSLPDLAVAIYDCERDGETLRVRVSNLGAASSGRTNVAVYDSQGIKVAEKKVSSIKAPTDFVEKSMWVEFTKIPGTGELRIVVDEKNRMKELFKENNSIVVQ